MIFQTAKSCSKIIIGLLGILPFLWACGENNNHDQVHLGSFAYPVNQQKILNSCSDKLGEAGFSDNETGSDAITFSVRTPSNYTSDYQHPLLVVFSPAGKNRFSTERFTKLTDQATAAGFIIAYVDSKRMSLEAIKQLSRIPEQVEKKWCIDHKQIFFTGHSDGGTISMAMAFMEDTRHIPAAIVPSAMGIRKVDLEQYQCPEPLPVMIMHNKNDRHFPDFGSSAAKWWANCNHCALDKTITLENGCIEYQQCDEQGTTWFCPAEGSHSHWPDLNHTLIEFLKKAH